MANEDLFEKALNLTTGIIDKATKEADDAGIHVTVHLKWVKMETGATYATLLPEIHVTASPSGDME